MNGHTENFLTEEDISVLKRTLLDGYSEGEQESFIRLCQRTQMDPFSKQIYATRRWVKGRDGNKVPTLVPITSVQGLTAIAVRTGHYDGCTITWAGQDGVWKEEWLSEEFPWAAKCVVYHKQRSYPEVGIARWNAYCGKSYNPATKRWEVTDFWERLSDFMLGKVAKAQALRGAFPDQCSNLYISEELQGNISEADQYDDEAKVASNRKKEEELLKAAAAKGIKVVESKPTKATPAEAAAPAPDLPPKGEPPSAGSAPVTAPTKPSIPTPPAQATAPVPQEEPDDLDMEPTQPAAAAAASPEPAGPPAWSEHVIEGLRAPQFLGRKVGTLTPVELAAIEEQWLPKVKQVWDSGGTVKPAQKEDALAIIEAIKQSKMAKMT